MVFGFVLGVESRQRAAIAFKEWMGVKGGRGEWCGHRAGAAEQCPGPLERRSAPLMPRNDSCSEVSGVGGFIPAPERLAASRV